MVESLNTKVDLVTKATSFLGLSSYGKIMIGDVGFEFYNDSDIDKFIQIPWKDVDYVIASVLLRGRWIPRFSIQTKRNGSYTFAARHPKRVLRAIQKYVPKDRMVRSLSFWQVIKRGLKSIFSRKSKKISSK